MNRKLLCIAIIIISIIVAVIGFIVLKAVFIPSTALRIEDCIVPQSRLSKKPVNKSDADFPRASKFNEPNKSAR